ncbi:MAG TPA: SUMF1/EgtB/PvdO family nonheme iron enzyme [Pyrinomonadaceae bacterium]|nr:SUMF1/EgtB/PvdO family nonheme iron enzyme [Pyrinomonadaceae bacterium]
MKECPACRRCFSDEIIHCPQDGDATTPSLLGEPILDARYQLERRLGQGGMGVVFQARHIFLKTSHAIKVILPDLVGNDPMLVTRFRQEALAAAAIRHQNIIAVTDFGVVRGTMPFLVMEFVNGKSLQDILAEEKVMPPARALEFACAMGAGVGAAHKQNIVHRDLKPLNIMTQLGQPISEGLKILDFGLAKIKSGELLGSFVQAKTSGLMGSPFYMAPEQWSDDEPDARADVYSLGIILYQMLSGDVPFKGSSIPSIMKKHLTLPPPTFKSTGVDVSPQLEAVVRHALEKEISARTPTVEAFITELRQAVAAGGVTIGAGRETASSVPDETMFAPASSTGPTPQHTVPELAGTVSSSALDPREQAKLAATREAYEREQKEKERIAREELTREAEERRKAQEEIERKRQERDERVRKEQEEREERERQQREQMERVERQAKELEERLARLATSMPPQPPVGVVTGDVTQVEQGIRTGTVGDNSFPGEATAAATPYDSVPKLPTSIQRKSKSNSILMIGAIVLVVVIVGGAIGGYLLLRSKRTPPVGPSPTPTVASSPAQETEAIKADLVEIAGGTFQMGRNDGPFQERPEHSVTVQNFFMDRTEVTNAEYAQFVREMNYEAPADWARGKPLLGQELWPVANVSAADAQAFAAWRSKRDGVTYRLPTEEEWEYAARNGGEHKAFPWGESWQEGRAVVKAATPKPVGSLPGGKNRWGAVDLIGNISEWTSSKASIYDGRQIPPENRDWLVLRGGSYASNPDDPQIPISATYRDWFKPTLRHPTFGFRLVRADQ